MAEPKKKAASGPRKDKLDPKEIEREYGFAFQLFQSDPELWTLLRKAVDGGWGVTRFQAALRDTKWFKQHSDIWRQNQALRFADPATYDERLANVKTQIQNIAGQYGMDLTASELDRYSKRAFMLGWSPDQILDSLAKEIRPAGGHFGGQLAGMEENLRTTALANGIKLNNSQLTGWMRSIVKGDSSVEEYQTYIRNIAAKTFTAYGKELQAGVNLVDLAAPYVQSMADILELNPTSINMFDKTLRQAMSFVDPNTKEPSPMSITEFEDSLRADPRWQYTDNAKQTMRGYAVALGKMFGVL